MSIVVESNNQNKGLLENKDFPDVSQFKDLIEQGTKLTELRTILQQQLVYFPYVEYSYMNSIITGMYYTHYYNQKKEREEPKVKNVFRYVGDREKQKEEQKKKEQQERIAHNKQPANNNNINEEEEAMIEAAIAASLTDLNNGNSNNNEEEDEKESSVVVEKQIEVIKVEEEKKRDCVEEEEIEIEDGHVIVKKTIIRDHVLTIDNVVTKKECDRIINVGLNEGFTVPENKTVLDQRYRYQFFDTDIADNLFKSFKKCIPSTLPDGSELVRVRDKLRLYRYTEGEIFLPHVDGGSEYKRGKHFGEYSYYTFVLYLSDCESDGLIGGETRFCDVKRWPEDVSTFVTPKKGSCLLFRQKNMKHEGCLIKDGTKYIIQGMVMYKTPANLLEKGIIRLGQTFELVECSCDGVSVNLNSIDDQQIHNILIGRKIKKNTTNIFDFGSEGLSRFTFEDRLMKMICEAKFTPEMIRQKLIKEGLDPALHDPILQYLFSRVEKFNQDKQTSKQILSELEQEQDKENELPSYALPRDHKFNGNKHYRMLAHGISPKSVRNDMKIFTGLDDFIIDAQLSEMIQVLSEYNSNKNNNNN
eukprot:TRINITY_DN2242_c0_g1_i1.p1 TRINITY_DN2242_c0_g1~~TRINITY_DN2242_c0_g1_i1.p1  ORF type:complete len:586 (+),score=186.07 TRINITY_DN2242_c0_g1_i1:61-1818(+)